MNHESLFMSSVSPGLGLGAMFQMSLPPWAGYRESHGAVRSSSANGHSEVGVRRSKFGRKTRAEKSEEARKALFHAAAEIVGEHGYGSASISRITQRAKLAQGTFYNYFASRQAIFDELLPALGEEMLAHIRARVIEGSTFLDREERAFRAFFEFLAQVPQFLRILNEAEIAAPRAFRKHFRNVSAGY